MSPVQVVEIVCTEKSMIRAGIGNTYLTIVNGHACFPAHMTVLTAAIDGTIDARAGAQRASGANSDSRLIDIAHVEVRVDIETHYLCCSLTATASEDITRRQVIFLTLRIAHYAAGNVDCGNTTT